MIRSSLLAFRVWSVFWKVTLFYWVILHLYVTRLAYVTEGFWTGAFILAMPILGDSAVCWGSGRVPLIRALQAGIIMAFASWVWRTYLLASGSMQAASHPVAPDALDRLAAAGKESEKWLRENGWT